MKNHILSEHRLIYRSGETPSVAPPERETPRLFLEQLAVDLKEKIDTGKEYAEYLSKQIMERSVEEREALAAMIEGGTELPESLQELMAEVPALREQILASTKESLTALRAEASPFVEKVKDNLADATDMVLPEKWTKNMSRNHKAAVAAVGTVGLAIGAVLLMRGLKNLFGRGKDAKEAAAEAAKEKGGFWGKVFAGLVVGGLAFFGGKYLADKYIKEKIKDEVDEVKREAKEAAERAADAVRDAVTPDEETETEEEAEIPTETPAVEEAVDPLEALRQQSWGAMAKGLLIMNRDIADDADINITEENQNDAVMSALMNIDGNTTLDTWLSVQNQSDAQTILGARPDNAFAYLFLARIFQRMEPALKARAERSGKPWEAANLKMDMIVRQLQEGPAAVGRFLRSLEGNSLQEMDTESVFRLMFPEDASDGTGLESIGTDAFTNRLREINPDLEGKEGAFLQHCSDPKIRNSTIKDFTQKYESSADPYNRTILHIIASVQTPAMREYLLRFTHARAETSKALEEQLQQMTVGDALQLFAYSNAAHGKIEGSMDTPTFQKGDGMSSLLLQMKVLQLVGKQDESVGRDFRNYLLLNIGTDELTLPPEAQEAIGNIREFAFEQVVNSIVVTTERTLEEFQSLAKEFIASHPQIAASLGAGAALYIGEYLYDRSIYTRFLKLRRAKTFSQGRHLGYITEESFNAAKQLADDFFRSRGRGWQLQKYLRGRLPVVSTWNATRFDLADREITLAGYKNADSLDIARFLQKEHGVSEETAALINRIAEKAFEPGSAGYARGGRGVGFLERWRTWGRNTFQGGQSYRIADAWRCIDDLVDGKIPPVELLQGLGFSESEVAEITKGTGVVADGADDAVDTIRIGDAVDDPPAMRRAAGAESMSDPAPRVNPTDTVDGTPPLRIFTGESSEVISDVDPKLAKLLQTMRAGENAGDVEAFLKLAAEQGLIDLDPKTLSLIEQSPGAQKIIAGAIETTDVGEVTRALKAARTAAKFRVVLNAAGGVADVFGLYMAIADWQANDRRLEQAKLTKNDALRELYEQARPAYIIEGTASAAGLVFGTMAILPSALGGGGTIAALGASGGLVMLPIGVAVGVGAYGRTKIEAVTETWLRTSEDWKQEDPAMLRAKMRETASGQTYWQQSARGTRAGVWWEWATNSAEDYKAWEEKQFNMIQDANDISRYEMLKAYLANTTYLPQNEGEADTDYNDRIARYQFDQFQYLMANNESTDPMTSEYYQAASHAELMEVSRSLKVSGEKQMIKITRGSGETDGSTVTEDFNLAEYADLFPDKAWMAGYVIAAYREQQNEQKVMQFNIMKEFDTGPNARNTLDTTVQRSLVLDVRHDLMLAESRVQAVDLDGWEWTGGADESRGVVRMILSNELRKELRAQSDQLQELGTEATATEYAQSADKIRAVLHENNVQAIFDKQTSYGNSTPMENSRAYLDIAWLFENLYVFPPKEETADRQAA